MSFDLLSLFLQCIINDTFKNTDKELPCQKIKIYKKNFVLQVLSAEFNENFFVNLLGVWTASIFVELYEDSSSQ